jgi:CRP-like cAMP-binding protein
MAFIKLGSAKVRYVTGTGQEMVVTILSSGNYFGEIGMITGRPRSFDVVTIESMELFELTREDFIAHTQAFKGFSLSLLVAVAGRLEEAGKRLMDLTEQDIPTRLFRILLQLAQLKNVAGDNKMVVTPRPSTRDLIGLVGEPRDRVLAAFAKLQAEGILVDERDRLILNSIRYSESGA